MSNLPINWKSVPLLSMAEVHDRLRVPVNAKDRESRRGPFPYYGANGRVDTIDGYLFDGSYVLLAEDGGNFDKPERGVAYEVSGKFWVNNHAHILKAVPGISTRFLNYWLNAIDWMPHVGGTTRAKLTQAGMGDVYVPLPPAEERKHIETKITHLRSKTAKAAHDLSMASSLVENYRKAIFNMAFSGDLSLKWRGQNNLEKKWTSVRLDSVAHGFEYGTSAKSAVEGRVPVLRMGNIQNCRLDWGKLVYTSDAAEIDKYILRKGEVLFNRTNSPELVGKTAVFDGERDAVYAGYLIRIRCSSRLNPYFLNYLLNSPIGRDYSWRVKTDGVSQSNINAKKIAAFEFELPCIEEQAEIVRALDIAFAWIDRVEAECAASELLVKKLDLSVLRHAMTGKLLSKN